MKHLEIIALAFVLLWLAGLFAVEGNAGKAVVSASDAFAATQGPQPCKLWYSQSAKDYMSECLPIGKSRIGAMIFHRRPRGSTNRRFGRVLKTIELKAGQPWTECSVKSCLSAAVTPVAAMSPTEHELKGKRTMLGQNFLSPSPPWIRHVDGRCRCRDWWHRRPTE